MIQNEEEYDTALALVERLIFSKARTGAEEEMFMPLVLAIEEYEATHYPMDPSSPHEVLQHIMDSSGISKEELSTVLGNTVDELEAVLRGDVQLTDSQAIALGKRFVVKPELFMPIYCP